MNSRLFSALITIAVCIASLPAFADDFMRFEADSTTINFATYSEAGYTATPNASQVNIEDPGAGDDGRLVMRTFTNLKPNVTVTNDNNDPFELVSLDIDEFVTGHVTPPRGFFVDASSGASHQFTGTGLVDFSLIAGDWTNLSSITFRYEGVSSTEVLAVDNIRLSAIPEPATLLLTVLAGAGMLLRRRA